MDEELARVLAARKAGEMVRRETDRQRRTVEATLATRQTAYMVRIAEQESAARNHVRHRRFK